MNREMNRGDLFYRKGEHIFDHMLKLLAIIGVLMHGIRNIEFHLALPSRLYWD